MFWCTYPPAGWGLLLYKWLPEWRERSRGWSLSLRVALPVSPALLPSALLWASADGQSGTLILLRLSSVRSYTHPQNKKNILGFFSSFIFTFTLYWRGKSLFVFSFRLKTPDFESGFRIFTKWSRDPSALNAAWGLMSRTILSLKVSRVYFSFQRDQIADVYSLKVLMQHVEISTKNQRAGK